MATIYQPQPMDLLTPAMNMIRLKQSQEEMGLLRDYRQMQMKQIEVEQQKAEQQVAKQSFDEWLNIYDKISPEVARVYAKNNPQSMKAFQGLDESVLYSNDFQTELAESTKKVQKLKEISRDPRTIQEVTTKEYNNLMSKYGGKDKYKEALTQFGKGIPSEKDVQEQQAQIVFQSLQDMPEEDRPEWEPKQEASLAGLSPALHKQWLEQKAGGGKLPYKIGERQKFTGGNGRTYEGTFTGLDEKNEPVFNNIVKVYEKPEKPEKPSDYDKKWARAKGVVERKLKRKALDDEIAKEYKTMFGSEDLIGALLGGMIGGGKGGYVADEKGNLIPK